MQAPLKDRLENWKLKCFSKTREKKNSLAHIARLKKRISNLETELSEYECRFSPQKIPFHSYPCQMVAMAVFIVVVANGSLRCAAKTVAFFAMLMGWDYGKPSHVTIRNWVLRCGFHSLEGGVEKEGDYIGIMDESIEIGGEKLLLLLGFKSMDDRNSCAPLGMSDVEVLGMEVQRSWNGEDISDFVERRRKHHSGIKLDYMITDGGTALLSALKKLGICGIRDCSHILMNIAKRLFSEDSELSAFCAEIGRLRQKLHLTEMPHLLPPTLRDKDRFLRIFVLTDWYDRIVSHWDNLPEAARDKLDFLHGAEGLMERMGQVRDLISITSRLFKSAGISSQSIELWESRVRKYALHNELTDNARLLVDSIRKYFSGYSEILEKHQRILCCSDIVESTFGKYKNKGGMKVISADVLAIALYGQKITTEFVMDAMVNTRQSDIKKWHQKYTCDNRFSILYRMNKELKNVA